MSVFEGARAPSRAERRHPVSPALPRLVQGFAERGVRDGVHVFPYEQFANTRSHFRHTSGVAPRNRDRSNDIKRAGRG